MTVVDSALVFACGDDDLVGVLSAPSGAGAPGSDLGVLVVVGGPQYRAGSHRQFVLLARRIAEAGLPVLRFDVHGMGDSSGDQASFEATGPDIAAAIDALQARQPQVRRVVLWGLCDAASAALIYCHERPDPRVAGLCLANPWVRSDVSRARTEVRHYYRERLMQREFWLKLLRGGVAGQAWRGLRANLATVWGASAATAPAGQPPFQQRMRLGWQAHRGPVLLLQSGADFTAREFDDLWRSDASWRALVSGAQVRRVDIAGADHTFSDTSARRRAEDATLIWLNDLAGRAHRTDRALVEGGSV